MFHRNATFMTLAAIALVAALLSVAALTAYRSAASALNRAANPAARLVGKCGGVLHYEKEESDFPAAGCEWIRPVEAQERG